MKFSFTKAFLLFLFSTTIHLSSAQVNVVTQHNNIDRTGWNNRETILTKNNTRIGSFGKLFSLSVDDQMYAQPLIVQQVNLAVAGKKNILIAATVNNSVYAFDADSLNANQPYWKVNLTPAGERPVKQIDLPGACPGNFLSNIGIVGTPVIDTATNTIYLVARSINASTVKFSQYLHALDISTGLERANSPVLIKAQVSGSGDGNINGIVNFDAQKNNQRPGLLLLKGVVYIGFSSHCDWGPYHGWLLGYNAGTLTQQFVYNDTPDGYNGGIWMSGTGPAADSLGNIYFSIGNGSVGKNNNPSDLTNRAESVVRLNPDSAGAGNVKDFFTPNNYPDLEAADLDLGTSGIMIIPDSKRILTGCKDGNIYLLNQDNLGGYNAAGNKAVQSINLGNNANMHAQFSYYKGTANEYAYFWPENTALKAVPFNRVSGSFDQQLTITSGIQGPVGQTGAMLSVSSNGSIDSSAILWSSSPVNCDGENYNCPGILRAIDATDVTKELWNSGIISKDNPGNFAKFSSPTIANGKVYLGTFSNQLIVYGLTTSFPDTCNTPNIALHKTVVSGSNITTQPAGNVVDGDITSSWTSVNNNPQSIYIDLGKRYDLCSVVLRWGAAFGQDFKIQVSDDALSWQTMANITANISATVYLNLQGTGRFVRMYGTAAATSNGFSLNEFEVFGSISLTECAPPIQLIAANIYEHNVTLNWQKNGSDSFKVAYKSVAENSWNYLPSNKNSVSLTGLLCGTDYYFKVKGFCADTSGSQYAPVVAFSTLGCNSSCAALPSQWTSQDIGNTATTGSACFANGLFTLTASGNDIWDVSDQFHYAYVVLNGDGAFIAKVASLDSSNGWNKCGLMIRESVDPGAKHAFIALTSGNGAAFQYRQYSDGTSNNYNQQALKAPYWIKLLKNGSMFSAFISPNGSSWTAMGDPVDLGFGTNTPVFCGIALTSHDNTILSNATINNLSTAGFTETDLKSFTGELTVQQTIQLNWTTSLEKNIDYFIIEKSNDNNLFTAMDSVKAASSGRFMTNYQSLDKAPFSGVNYYRLKMVDVLGNFSYSQLVIVRFTQNKIPLVYPNPVANFINILQGEESIISISIYDLNGRLLVRKLNDNLKTLLNIPLFNLPKSVYTIETRTKNNIYRNKFLKR